MSADAPSEHKAHAPTRIRFAILTVSDSRDLAHDASGDLLQEMTTHAGHEVAHRALVRDEPDEILRALDAALPSADVLLVTGGTGVAARDVTPETIAPRFEKRLSGFGELFRALSWQEIGSPAMLSRAEAGIVQSRAVFLMPGSPKACRLAMEKLILPEAGHLVGLLQRKKE